MNQRAGCVPDDCIVMAHNSSREGETTRWLTSCLCGFLVHDLGTREAAEDTRLHHLGLPSLLGSVQ